MIFAQEESERDSDCGRRLSLADLPSHQGHHRPRTAHRLRNDRARGKTVVICHLRGSAQGSLDDGTGGGLPDQRRRSHRCGLGNGATCGERPAAPDCSPTLRAWSFHIHIPARLDLYVLRISADLRIRCSARLERQTLLHSRFVVQEVKGSVNASPFARYCGCGTRLSRTNQGVLCAACQSRSERTLRYRRAGCPPRFLGSPDDA